MMWSESLQVRTRSSKRRTEWKCTEGVREAGSLACVEVVGAGHAVVEDNAAAKGVEAGETEDAVMGDGEAGAE